MLEVGQWDQEDSYGGPAVYRALEPKDKNNDMVSLCIGPWRHSGANHYGYELGALTFTGDTAREWRVEYVKPFFDHWLKGGPDPKTPPVLTYATGINKWQQVAALADGHARSRIYLAAGSVATFERPKTRRPRRIRQRSRRSRCRSSRARSTWATRRSGSRGWCATSASSRIGPTSLVLEERAARQGGAHHGRAAGRVVRLDHRHATATGS